MTTDTSAEGRVGSRWAGIARLVMALVLLAAGLWATGAIGLWYGLDNVFVSGARLRHPSAVHLPAVVAGLVLVAGIVTLVLRRRFRGAPGLLGLGAVVVVGVIAAALAVSAYPPIVDAKVTSIDPDTRAMRWSTDVPLTRVSGVSHLAEGEITLWGTYTGHGCSDEPRHVTLDPATGEVLRVDRHPSSDRPPGVTPASDPTLEGHGLAAQAGSLPFICLD